MPATRLKENSDHAADLQRLRKCVPLHNLPEEAFDSLLEHVSIDQLDGGSVLFKAGDVDPVSYFLLSGQIELRGPEGSVGRILAESEQAKFPIANLLPRQHGACAIGAVTVARVDGRLISEALAQQHKTEYQVDDLNEDDGDWMSLMLRSPILQQVPAANIQRVMMLVEQVEVRVDEVVIRQGAVGDFYYMLIRGHAQVSRDMGDGEPSKHLALLGPGDTFGEEALLSDRPRNSTITMLEEGAVLRLAKTDFLQLIGAPLSSQVGFDQAQHKVDQGAIWVDVRPSRVYDAEHLPGVINLPVETLRYQMESLAPDRDYVLYSDNDGRASVAAFLLIQQGFNVSVLSGARPGEAAPQAANQPLVMPEPAADMPPGSAAGSELQERVAQAEQRARDLEAALEQGAASAEQAEQEGQRQLDQAQASIEQVNRKLAETEQARLDALQTQRQAQSEMEALSSDLQRLQSERTQLADRIREMEGLDKKLQRRLKKLDRELIGERERAESAASSLEELAERMNESLQDREAERLQHARERGELKEQITELQLALDVAGQDLEELRGEHQQRHDGETQASVQLVELQAELTRLQGLESEFAALNRQHEAQARLVADLQTEALEYTELLSRRNVELRTLREQLKDAQQALADSTEKHAQQQAALRDEGLGLNNDLQDQLALTRGRIESLEQALQQQAGRSEQLQQQLDAAGEQDDRLREQLASSEQALSELRTEHSQLQHTFDGAGQDELRDQLLAGEQTLADLQAEHEQLLAQHQQQEQASEQLMQQLAEAEQQTEQLEQLQQALSAAESGDSELRAQLLAAEQALAELQAEHQQLQEQQQAQQLSADELQQQLAQAGAQAEQVTQLQQELDQLRAQLDETKVQRDEFEQAQQQLQVEFERTQQQLQEQDEAGAQAEQVAQLQQELDQLRTQLDETETQRAGLERELSGQQQQIAELETQLQEQAEQQQHLQQSLDEAGEGDAELRAKLESHNQELSALQGEREQLTEQLREQRQQGDELQQALEDSRAQTDQLRGVMETHAEQIRQAQGDDDVLAAMRSELDMVRSQASQDLDHLREQLSIAEDELNLLRQSSGVEAVSDEAARQQLDELEQRLTERQRELAREEEARHMLEDRLEDANSQIEELRRELDQVAVDIDEAKFRADEAEQARLQVQETLQALQQQAEQAKVEDLRDARMQPRSRPLDIDKVTGGRLRTTFTGALIGAALVVAVIEVVSILGGHGELFGRLF